VCGVVKGFEEYEVRIAIVQTFLQELTPCLNAEGHQRIQILQPISGTSHV